MNDLGPAPMREGALVERVKAILLSPRTEWPRIDTEPSTIGDIYRSHVLPLAAIGPVATLIGSLVFGYGAFGISYRPTLMGAVGSALVSYVLALVGVYLLALVIDGLAPQFGATKNRTQAFKVAAYGATAGWVAGIFGLLPQIAFLGLLGLYSLYLIYLGLPIVMKAPADKAGAYTGVVVVVTIVLALILGALTAPIAGMFTPRIDTGTISGTLNVPGAGSVDLSKLEAAGKKMEAAAERMQRGEPGPVIAPDALQAMLPASLPGLARTSIENSSAGAAGFGGSHAEARYGDGNNSVSLSITDLGAAGGLAALGGALNVQSSRQTETAYEKVGKVDGRMTTEKYDSSSKSGAYSTLVGDRVMVEAKGNAASIDLLKGAVAAIDLSRLEALAKQ